MTSPCPNAWIPAFLAGVVLTAPFAHANLSRRKFPNYHEVTLNDCCHRECETVLSNATATRSAALVVASQFRNRSGVRETGCNAAVRAKSEGENIIVSLIQMNLRRGILNSSCIDYVSITTTYTNQELPVQCGRVVERDLVHYYSSHSVAIKLYSPTPASYFFSGHTLMITVTSSTEPINGACGPDQFLCVLLQRCIFIGYKCDGFNNCGDDSDEARFGTSTCFIPLSSLILITFGITTFAVTCLSVLYCCVKSALARKKANQKPDWSGGTVPMQSGISYGGASTHDVTGQSQLHYDTDMLPGRTKLPFNAAHQVRKRKSWNAHEPEDHDPSSGDL